MGTMVEVEARVRAKSARECKPVGLATAAGLSPEIQVDGRVGNAREVVGAAEAEVDGEAEVVARSVAAVAVAREAANAADAAAEKAKGKGRAVAAHLPRVVM